MTPSGSTTPERSSSPSEKKSLPPLPPWQSPWSLEDEWINHWPVPRSDSEDEENGDTKPALPNRVLTHLPSARAASASVPAAAAHTSAPTSVLQTVLRPSNPVITPKPPTTRLPPATSAPQPQSQPQPPVKQQTAPAPLATTSPTERFRAINKSNAAAGNRQQPHLPPKRRESSWFGSIVLSLGLLGFTFLAWVYLQDSPPETDEDLRIALPVDQTPLTTVPQRLRSFLDSVLHLENHQLGQKAAWQWDTPSLAQFVSANGVALDNLRDLLEDADWHPLHSGWHAQDLGMHTAWPDVRILLQAQAAYLMRRGDEEGAFTAAMDLAELSRRLQELWTWPSFETHAQDLHTAAVQTMADLLKDCHLDSARLLAFQEEFLRCQPSDEVLKGALNAHYIHEKKMLLGPASGEPLDTMPAGLQHPRPGRLFFKINQTLSLFATAFRELKTEVATAPYAAFNVTGDNIRRTRQTSAQFYQPNAAGEKYFADHIHPYLRLPELHSLGRARHGLVMTFFAIRRYAADHQRLPGSLADLRPTYLTEIPTDPFSGESFHYDPKNGLLYSVGDNLITEGGKPTDPALADDREPTLRLGITTK